MDYLTTADLARRLDDHARMLFASDPKVANELRMCAHFLRLYAALECVYREKLGDDFYQICDQVNRLFSKDHMG